MQGPWTIYSMLDKDANSNNLVSLSVRRKLWQVKYQTKKGTGNPNRPTKGVRELWEKCEKHQAKAVKLPTNDDEQDEEEEEQNASRRLAADKRRKPEKGRKEGKPEAKAVELPNSDEDEEKQEQNAPGRVAEKRSKK